MGKGEKKDFLLLQKKIKGATMYMWKFEIYFGNLRLRK